MYDTGNSTFERPAVVQVNIEQQIQMSNNILFALKPGTISTKINF